MRDRPTELTEADLTSASREGWGLDVGAGGFVVAPVPALTGAPARRVTPRHALSAHPFVDGSAGPFGAHRREDRGPMVDLVATLHLRTPDSR